MKRTNEKLLSQIRAEAKAAIAALGAIPDGEDAPSLYDAALQLRGALAAVRKARLLIGQAKTPSAATAS